MSVLTNPSHSPDDEQYLCTPLAEELDERHPDERAERLTYRPSYRILQSVFYEILADLRWSGREEAGLLAGPRDSNLVTHYVKDVRGQATVVSFTIDADGLNRTLAELRRFNLTAHGIVHSHPPGVTMPSGGDVAYLARLFGAQKNGDCREVFFPIVCASRIYPYLVRASLEIVAVDLILV